MTVIDRAKGTQTATEYGHPEVQAQTRIPLRDASAMNTTRWAIYDRLVAEGLPVELGTAGRAQFNRTRLGLPKAHWIDAACVGSSTPDTLDLRNVQPLHIQAMGHGTRQVCGTNRFGFPIRHRPRVSQYPGWQTGDLVRAVIPQGKYAGVHSGRIAIRFRPAFRLRGFDVHPRHLTRLQRADGYACTTRKEEAHSPVA